MPKIKNMPRDIIVLLEKKIDGVWLLVLPMIKNNHFSNSDAQQNWLSDSMYINEYYPEPIYCDYNPSLWELMGVEGKYSTNVRNIPDSSCSEIKEHHKSFGKEAFDEHWISCNDFIENVIKYGASIAEANDIVDRIKKHGEPLSMRLILWFTQ